MNKLLKKEILCYLENQTAFFDLEHMNEVFTAQRLADHFGVKRNTVSHYLNQLNDEQLLVKINSRPVIYFHKEAFEKQFFKLRTNFYFSIDDLKEEQPFFAQPKDLFSFMIGYDASLKESIEQIKTALYYPDGGLPLLITGESGTGKSYLVNLVYQYCLLHDLLEDSAPFITFNCAQYADNPELLTSNLFGHVKGAYTGAEENKKGAFEAADGGILFLDEVHRLTPEGQEKLFTYLDQGVIYRMGEPNLSRRIKTRLFFATTEEITSHFLTTFIRRIPIRIELPALNQRSRNERLELIYSFFLEEQRKMGSPLSVSGPALSLLTSQKLSGNIGELKNIVKVSAAKAYAEQREQPEIHVTIHHLQKELLAQPITKNTAQQGIYITQDQTLEQLMEKQQPEQQRIVKSFEQILIDFKKNNCLLYSCEGKLKQEVIQLFDFLLFETSRQEKHELLVYWTQSIRETFRQMETAYQIKFDGNSVYALSYYLYQRSTIKWLPEEHDIIQLIKELEQQVSQSYPSSYHYVQRILELSKIKLDIEDTSMDRILLTIYLKKAKWSKEKRLPKAMIAAHGYATASSMANVVNRLLQEDLFESFDMPLDVTPQQIASEILDYCENSDVSNGLIILVDMGSLKEIHQFFKKQLSVPLLILNNVTTPLAITVGECLQKNVSLEEIAEETVRQIQPEWRLLYPEENKPKALITTCFTGIGTAVHLSELLEKSLPTACQLKIIPYEYQQLKDKKNSDPLFSIYEVVGMIGATDPDITNIDYLSLEDLISGEKMSVLAEWLDTTMNASEKEIFNQRIIRNFSLEKVLDSVTILDTEKVMGEIDHFMRELEVQLNRSISNPKKLALYVHVSCLIERLIRQMPIETYQGLEKWKQCQKEGLSAIKSAFSVIEEHYSVMIPNSEIAYIYDILSEDTEFLSIEEEF